MKQQVVIKNKNDVLHEYQLILLNNEKMRLAFTSHT